MPEISDDELNKFRTKDAIEFLRCRNPNGLDDNKCILIVDYIDTLKAELKAKEAEAADWRAYGNRWAENYTVLEAENAELNAELQKRERWMKDNSVWDDYCAGVVPSGPPKPSEVSK